MSQIDDAIARTFSTYPDSKSDKLSTLAEDAADRQQLPKQCIRCGCTLYGLERSRLGVWNDVYGALCNKCNSRSECRCRRR